MTGTGPPSERAGPGAAALFALVPPVLGSVLGGLLLTGDGRVPTVLTGSVAVALVCAVALPGLGRRSRDFRDSLFRRLTEVMVLLGLTATALIVYTLVVYLLLDLRSPWALNLLKAALPG